MLVFMWYSIAVAHCKTKYLAATLSIQQLTGKKILESALRRSLMWPNQNKNQTLLHSSCRRVGLPPRGF